MKCDKCQSDFESQQMLRDDFEISRNASNVDWLKSLGFASILDANPPCVVSTWLCQKCFQAVFRKRTRLFTIIGTVAIVLVDLFILSLILFGKWDSGVQKIIGASIALVVINGLFVLVVLVTMRRYKRGTPTPADRASFFAPPRRLKLEVLGRQLADPIFRKSVDRIIKIYLDQAKRSDDDPITVPEIELRSVGIFLNDGGGINLMRLAHADFVSHGGSPKVARHLKYVWEGIGDWEA